MMMFEAYPDQRNDLRWVSISLTSIAILLLGTRLTATWKNRGWFGMEDVCVVLATLWLVIFTVMIWLETHYGFGLRLKDIKAQGGDAVKAMKYFWMTLLFYTLCNGFNKLAFLTLYYRVFPTTRFRRLCLVLIAASIGWTVSYFFVAIFQCNPVQRVYDRLGVPGTCINFTWHRWTNAATNLVTDFLIFFLPMPSIMKLNMDRSQRLGLIFLFSIGFFICIITVLRMVTLPLTLKTKEPTWESPPTNLWSYIEASVGVICACLISLRRSISQLWPQRWRSHRESAGYRSGSYSRQPVSGSHAWNRKSMGGMHMDQIKGVRSGQNTNISVTLVSRSESQERIIDGIMVTKQIHVEEDNKSMV